MTSPAPNVSVDRYLKDKAMDRIDHALGRPIDPLKPTYRSCYAIDRRGSLAAEMRDSPHWEIAPGRSDMAYFYVTDEGRKALAAHLAKIGDLHRLYRIDINWDGRIEPVYRAATSRGKAKYAAYLDISDCYSELTFAEFQRMVASVRLA